jgi:hypothetical protein
MRLIFRPYVDDTVENRPGAELFFVRTLIFLVFLILAIALFSLQLNEMSLLKKLVCLSVVITLLVQAIYHACLFAYFKTLKYELTSVGLNIKTICFSKKITFSHIRKIENMSCNYLKVQSKNIFSYLKETPQLIYPIGQYGGFTMELIGTVNFYSTVDSFREPKNLILITTFDGEKYGVSPERPDEFVGVLKKGIDLRKENNDESERI